MNGTIRFLECCFMVKRGKYHYITFWITRGIKYRNCKHSKEWNEKKKTYVDFLHDNEMSIVNVEECPTMRIINTVHFKMEVNII